jgi:hypothetical protein
MMLERQREGTAGAKAAGKYRNQQHEDKPLILRPLGPVPSAGSKLLVRIGNRAKTTEASPPSHVDFAVSKSEACPD